MPRLAAHPSLVHLLHQWRDAPAHDESDDSDAWVQTLSQWLTPVDAITLGAALQSLSTQPRSTAPVKAARTVRGAAQPLDQALEQVRTTLRRSLQPQAPTALRRSTGTQAPPDPTLAVDRHQLQSDLQAEAALQRQRYLDLQRRMDLLIGPLRQHCREQLAVASPALAQLATLDAALEHTLGRREQALLARLPQWLDQRLQSLRRTLGNPSPAGDTDAPINPVQARALLQEQVQALAMAEIDLRLQPLQGMVQAWLDWRNATQRTATPAQSHTSAMLPTAPLSSLPPSP